MPAVGHGYGRQPRDTQSDIWAQLAPGGGE
jgi:hypothetical protein